MGAKTSWFFCGICGFRNHPRIDQDNELCEQCGSSREHDEAYDYEPGVTPHA